MLLEVLQFVFNITGFSRLKNQNIIMKGILYFYEAKAIGAL